MQRYPSAGSGARAGSNAVGGTARENVRGDSAFAASNFGLNQRRLVPPPAYRIKCDKDPLSSRLGPPDFYPQSPNCGEETLIREYIQSGYKETIDRIETIFASGVNFCLPSRVISVRGPVFCTLFNPVQIISATMLAFLLLHEELHIGSLIGDVAVIGGLYIVLWGKAGDFEATEKLELACNFAKNVISMDQQSKDC